MISFTGPLRLWTGADGSSHFMSISDDLSGEIHAHALLFRRGFGSVKVEANVQGFCWQTSVFPSKRSGGYFLPIKRDVLRKTGIAEGDDVTVMLELL